MKYFLTWLCGLLLGAAVALAGVYYNPLIDPGGTQRLTEDWRFDYTYPLESPLAFTHAGVSRLPTNPAGISELWEATISGAALAVFPLRGVDDTPPVGAASRITVPSEGTDFIRRGVMLDDYWLLTVPGEGSLFIHAQSNVWPLLRDAVLPVWYLKRPPKGPQEYRPTVGPMPERTGLVIGLTGRFDAVEGRAGEHYGLEAFDASRGPRGLTGELVLDFDEAETFSDSAASSTAAR